jgi:hypothetical protein
MAVPGYKTKLYARSDNTTAGSSDEIDGLNDGTYEELAELLESTNFKGASATPWKARIVGLQDGSIALAGDYIAASAPMILLKTSKRSGADVFITFLVDPTASAGSQGFRVPCKVSKFTLKDTTGGKTEFSCDLSFNGVAPTDV